MGTFSGYLTDWGFSDPQDSQLIKLVKLFIYQVPGDGSCFFSSVLLASSKLYRSPNSILLSNSNQQDREIWDQRTKLISDLRHHLADKLEDKVSNDNPISHYDSLANGEMREFADTYGTDEYKLEQMQENLRRYRFWPNEIYLQYVSNILNLDIYILELKRRQPFLFVENGNVLTRNRRSIVLLYDELSGHFEPVGLIRRCQISDVNSKPQTDFHTFQASSDLLQPDSDQGQGQGQGQDQDLKQNEEPDVNNSTYQIDTCFSPRDPFISLIRHQIQLIKKSRVK